MTWLAHSWQSLAWSLGVLLCSVVAGLVVHAVLFAALGRLAARTHSAVDDAVVGRLRGPVRLVAPLLAIELADSALRLPAGALAVLERVVSLALVAAVAWFCVRLLDVLEAAVVAREPQVTDADLAARRVRTQLRILRRVLVGVVVVVAGAIMLLTFPRVRTLGASLLASAGVVALVAGVALRPAVANLVAGIHIAVSRPINIGDVVVVEGEWGRIEEITLTYVVVCIWDLRRLVLPISHFTDKPFQNWTRGSPTIIGSVFVYADYTVPVAAVREELLRILKASPRWDGVTASLQVTDATERTVQLRAIMSAADSSTAWDLRCEVRERLIEYLQREHPGCLPRLRAELDRAGAGAGGAAA